MRKFSLMLLLLFTIAVANAQKGAKERIKVYSRAIEGNLANDPAERDVTVYLPHELLESYGIPHFYESYEGDHLNRIAERIRAKMLPFFSEHLGFE